MHVVYSRILTGEQVGSHTLPGIEVVPTSSTSTSTSTPAPVPYASEASSNSYSSSGGNSMHQPSHNRSLPMLHTRMAYPEYDSYNTSPEDDYTYASNTLPRHDSMSSNYSAEGFRPYTGSMAVPSVNANMYYEPGAAYSFGSLHAAPSYQPGTSINRLPSVTGDSFSPLNMSSLHSSLPTQTRPERRLPVPCTPQQESYGSTEVPQIRPLTSFTEPQHRPHTGGIYSRNSMSWSMASPAPSRNASIHNLTTAASHGLPGLSSADTDSMQNAAPILGYQFSSSGSPEDTSPIASSALSESYSSASSSSTIGASMLPPSSVRYGTALPALRPSSSQEGSASLYSFSSGRDTPVSNISQIGSEGSSSALRHQQQQQTYAQVRHPQPQHAASVDELRRRSSYDQQQQQRAATAHRMSVSNLNARY